MLVLTLNARTDSLGQQSGTFDIAQVQVEAGPVATSFERRPIGTELSLCQRYFCKSYGPDVAPGTVTSDGVTGMVVHATSSYPGFGTTRFPVTMRATPSVTTYNPSTGGTTTPVRNVNTNTNHPLIASYVGAAGFSANVDNSSISISFGIIFHWTASAEL
jgi:hypothetical protein